jgi:hypothetical protein
MVVALAVLLACTSGSDLTDPTEFSAVGKAGAKIKTPKGHRQRFPGEYPKAALTTNVVGPNAAGQFAGVALFDVIEGFAEFAVIWQWTPGVGFVTLRSEDLGTFKRNLGGHVELNDNGTVFAWSYEGFPNDGVCYLFLNGGEAPLSQGLPAETSYSCLTDPNGTPGSGLHADDSIDAIWVAVTDQPPGSLFTGEYGSATWSPTTGWTLGSTLGQWRRARFAP